MFWNKEKIVIVRPHVDLVKPIPEEFRGWLSQSVGKYYKDMLMEMMEELRDGWVNDDYNRESEAQTRRLNSEALGKAKMLAEILVQLEELSADEEDITY